MGYSAPEEFERDILLAKESLEDAPFAVNLLMALAQKEHVDACIRHRVPIVTMFFGGDATLVSALHEYGAIVYIQIGTFEEAQHALAIGADGLIVQGLEAGGHLLARESLAAVAPRIREAFPNIPVIASGGIHDSASAENARRDGADAVSCGTRFLMTNESFAHGAYKKRLAESEETMVTNLFGLGWRDRHRVVPNAATRKWCTAEGQEPRWLKPVHRLGAALGKNPPPQRTERIVAAQSLRIPLYTPATLTADMEESRIDVTAIYAGECVKHISGLLSARDVVNELSPKKI